MNRGIYIIILSWFLISANELLSFVFFDGGVGGIMIFLNLLVFVFSILLLTKRKIYINFYIASSATASLFYLVFLIPLILFLTNIGNKANINDAYLLISSITPIVITVLSFIYINKLTQTTSNKPFKPTPKNGAV